MKSHSSHCVDGNDGAADEVVDAIDEGIVTQEAPTEETQIPQKEEQGPLLAPLNLEGTHICCTQGNTPHSSPG